MSDRNDLFIVMTDGASSGNPGEASTGWVLWNRNSDKPIASGGRSLGIATNNEAEWQALIDGLNAAKAHGARHVVAYTDSLLVAQQFKGDWKCKHKALDAFRCKAWNIFPGHGRVAVKFVYRQILHLADAEARRNAL